MEKPLIDEQVAKALGWKREGARLIGSVKTPIQHRGWWYPNGDFFSFDTPPAFTTSLDAIVAEIEARGLFWRVDRVGGAQIGTQGVTCSVIHGYTGYTPPLALCAALLAYLKEHHAKQP